MEYPYMVVAFLEPFKPGQIIEPPKHAHVTVKKKFKLSHITEGELIKLLSGSLQQKRPMQLSLGDSKPYENEAFMVVEVLNAKDWGELHNFIMAALKKNTQSHDAHFEGLNYYPHVSWKTHGQVHFDATPLADTDHRVHELYLIKRIDPQLSRVQIIAQLSFNK